MYVCWSSSCTIYFYYYVPTWEFHTNFLLNFLLGKNLAYFPLTFSDQTQDSLPAPFLSGMSHVQLITRNSFRDCPLNESHFFNAVRQYFLLKHSRIYPVSTCALTNTISKNDRPLFRRFCRNYAINPHQNW